MTEPLCTCGKRPKHKCCEESEHKSGKLCLKCDNKDFDELRERLWKEYPEEMTEARAWVKEQIEEIKRESIN